MKLKTIIIFLIVGFSGCKSLLFPRNVEIENPSQAVTDARNLIKEFKENPQSQATAKNTRFGCLPLDKKDLPASLQLDIKYAFVCDDHVSLVFHRNPDNDLGLRIWSVDANDKGSDKPTKWADIYEYSFNSDVQLSRDNNP